jgi:hypothetical protein
LNENSENIFTVLDGALVAAILVFPFWADDGEVPAALSNTPILCDVLRFDYFLRNLRQRGNAGGLKDAAVLAVALVSMFQNLFSSRMMVGILERVLSSHKSNLQKN